MRILLTSTALAAVMALGLAGCDRKTETETQETAQAGGALSQADAEAFIKDAEKQLSDMSVYEAHVAWVNNTYINEDTNWLAAKAGAEFTELAVKLANQTKKYQHLDLPPDLARKMNMLRTGITLPAPEKPGAADELSKIATDLQAAYGKGKGLYKGEVKPGVDLEALMGTVRDPKDLLEMWTSWREVGKPMKNDYARLVEIANAGARELGFADAGEMWRANYDMPPEDFAKLVDKLWDQVKPLYNELQCHVRAKLNEKYGDDVAPLDQPIPAHLLGNMWAQEWGNIYDIAGPKNAGPGYDLTALLNQRGYTPKKMVETGEGFFTSLGFDPLPETFWERSMLTKPADREVVCHASAWDIDNKNDVRIKMCIKVNADDFETVHHELGHNFYQRAYQNQDPLYLDGANDGFHEAIGDMIGLSITPAYLTQIGLLSKGQMPDASADIGLLMRRALDKVAFLPFGLLVDKWRWEVFSGKVAPADYNKAWWDLRREYQGVQAPAERGPDAFDPGAKYHIPGNTPYMRYFLARILQFQFHKAACEAAGWKGPLHRCSIYSNKEVGEKFKAMLEMGASKPWPEALEAFTGSREMDGTAILDYFAPLMAWLKEQNKGRQCGW